MSMRLVVCVYMFGCEAECVGLCGCVCVGFSTFICVYFVCMLGYVC